MFVTKDTGDTLSLEIHPSFLAFSCHKKGEEMLQPFQLERTQAGINNSIDHDNLKAWLKRNQSVWSRPYDSVKIAVHTPFSTLVPEESLAKPALNLLENIPEHFETFSIKMNDDVYRAFAIDKEIYALINNYFYKAQIVPGIQGCLEYLLKKEHSENKVLSAIVYQDMIHICYLNEGKLEYLNAFPFSTKEDVLYYILLTYKMLELNPDYFPLHLYGFIEQKSSVHQLLFQFIRNISIEPIEAPISTDDLQQANCEAHYLINLLSLHS